MEYATTMTSTGQVTIPKELREFLNIHPGDRVTFRKGRDAISIDRCKTVEEVFAAMDAVPVPPEVQERIEKYRGMSASELREMYDNSPEGQAYYKEKYGV